MSRRSSIMVQKTYYQIAVITLITAVMWVLLGIYRALTTIPDVGVDQAILSPIQARIDETTVASISARNQLSKTALEQVVEIGEAISSTSPASVVVNEVTEGEEVEEAVVADELVIEEATPAPGTEAITE